MAVAVASEPTPPAPSRVRYSIPPIDSLSYSRLSHITESDRRKRRQIDETDRAVLQAYHGVSFTEEPFLRMRQEAVLSSCLHLSTADYLTHLRDYVKPHST
jgi:hypothetical protein